MSPRPTRLRVTLAAVLLLLPFGALPAAAAPADAPPPSAPDTPVAAGSERVGGGGTSTVDRTYIVTFGRGVPAATGVSGAAVTGAEVVTRLEHVFSGAIVRATPAQAQALAARPDVARVVPDQVVTGDAVQTGAPWGLDRIDQTAPPLNGRYAYTPSGHGVTAYVVDSGINATHQDFGGRVQPGVFVSEIGTSTKDCHGHGTHTSATVGGRTYGVAKSVSLVPVRVLDCENRGTVAGFIAGLEWVAGDHQPGQPAVANMSLGSDAVSPELDAAVQALINDGVTVAAAAGNDANSACGHSPGRLRAAITVGATTRVDARASFSNVGSCLDLFAPGEDIVSAAYDSNTGSSVMSGTSMATPHVAGAAALYLETHRGASPAVVASVLTANATPGKVTGAGTGSPNRLLHTSAFDTSVAPGTFWPTRPQRLLDTRSGASVPAHGTRTVQVTGRGGVPAVGVSAVVVNVTVTQPRTAGNVSVYPAGSGVPSASHLNFVPGQTTANLVTVKLGTNGQVSLKNNAGGSSHLIADVTGYYIAGSAVNNGSFTALNPARLLDTRGGSPVPADGDRALPVAGRGGVPSTGVGAVVLNVTATEPTRAGNLTVHPSGTPAPVTSNLNFYSGQTIPNLVVVRLGPDGQVNLKNVSAGSTHVIADVAGYYRAGAPSLPGTFVALTAARIFDSRPSGKPLAARSAGGVRVAGQGGVPASGVSAAMLNVTVTQPRAVGNLTAYPNGSAEPGTSNVNFVAGRTVPNMVAAKLGSGGVVLAKNNSAGSLHLVVDVSGYVRG